MLGSLGTASGSALAFDGFPFLARGLVPSFQASLNVSKAPNNNSYDRFACNLSKHVYASPSEAQSTPNVACSGKEAPTASSGAGAPCTFGGLRHVGTTEVTTGTKRPCLQRVCSQSVMEYQAKMCLACCRVEWLVFQLLRSLLLPRHSSNETGKLYVVCRNLAARTAEEVVITCCRWGKVDVAVDVVDNVAAVLPLLSIAAAAPAAAAAAAAAADADADADADAGAAAAAAGAGASSN